MPIYNKPTGQLMRDMISEMDLSEGKSFTKAEVMLWFSLKYPKIKKNTISCHLIKFSTNANSRHHYNAKVGEDDLFYQVGKSTYRLYNPSIDPQPLSSDLTDEDNESFNEPEEVRDTNEFAYERDLQNFLARNLELIEPGLKVYEEDGISGIEYPAGGRFIDILAVDKSNNFVVIELKVSKGYDRVIGQLLRYVSWVKRNIIEVGQSVRGVIIARDISEDLMLVCEELKDISLFEYELSVKLNQVKKM
ncbi:DUF91 domain-containing protein [Shewanella sp. MMG014]|uniref:endonuclease NucS domain-containing protein n=1 Tax=Shewanella sp. MMG014 TaxID=2822691 RepID=UPI001B3929BD|nr:endonuclease NucS domain-containing protein [Shewanella sp. MMG014]MBQ4891085.1 DUF91 domain-containing protein [Shewanella sp. MMG014]